MWKIAKHKKRSNLPPQTLDKVIQNCFPLMIQSNALWYFKRTGHGKYKLQSFQKIGRGFEKLMSNIEQDDGTNDDKSAEKIFKKMTKVRKLGTTHKKSIAAIAKLQKHQKNTRARTRVMKSKTFVFL